MRLNNRDKAAYYQFLSVLTLLIMLGGVGAFLIERYMVDFLGWESVIFIAVPILLMVIFYLRGRQIFEYDSDGEALNFRNRNVVTFLHRKISDEFPKYKLLKYEIIDLFIMRRLYVTISSKKNLSITLRYDISYLKRKEVEDLKTSLNKVVRKNKEKYTEKVS